MRRREVRSEDPSLSPEANRLLTDELREAVGSDHVDVPEGAPERSRERHGGGSPVRARLATHRLTLIVALLALLTVGVVVSLATGSWWALAAALAVHALGTLATAATALRFATEVEHVDPRTAARLEDEGVADPDRVLSDLVEDYGGPAQEQRTAMTPSPRAGEPAGSALNRPRRDA